MSRYIDADKLKEGLSIPSASIIEIGKAITAQIDAQPTADVRENVKGEWSNEKDDIGRDYYSCSNCCGWSPFIFHYCPYFGADMRGEA